MKKYAPIALVFFIVAFTFIHLEKGLFHKEQVDFPAKKSKKAVQIIDISENLSTTDSLAGNWILFLHYAHETCSVDITIDDSSMAVSKDREIIGDLSAFLDEDGSVKMDNEKAHLEGVINPEGNHLDGMATIQGEKAPVPFSAVKIGHSAQGN